MRSRASVPSATARSSPSAARIASTLSSLADSWVTWSRVRNWWPSRRRLDATAARAPAARRRGSSGARPRWRASASAWAKRTRSTSSSAYGSSRATRAASAPNRAWTARTTSNGIPAGSASRPRSDSACPATQLVWSSSATEASSPASAVRRSGSVSMTVPVRLPKAARTRSRSSTSTVANRSERRNERSPATVVGVTCSYITASNVGPYFGCSFHAPTSRTVCPSTRSDSGPEQRPLGVRVSGSSSTTPKPVAVSAYRTPSTSPVSSSALNRVSAMGRSLRARPDTSGHPSTTGRGQPARVAACQLVGAFSRRASMAAASAPYGLSAGAWP